MSAAAVQLDPREASRVVEEAIRDKSYRQYPLGQDAARFLRARRKRLTPASYRDYESILDKFARYFMHAELAEFDASDGVDRLETFLDEQWGAREPRTYNKALSVMHSFFVWQVMRGAVSTDPTLRIERAKAGDVERTTFNESERTAIIGSQDELRDRVALRLLLDYGLRKGALRSLQFKHFDHFRKRVTIFTKGRKVREIPIPSAPFWFDLERLILEWEAQPSHFVMQRQKAIPRAGVSVLHRFPDKPMGDHGLHDWWYGCLRRAGLVEEGVTSGERMHKARHSAGQRVLDKTGNIKAVQKLLGHASIQTTADVYTDWDIDQLAQTMAEVVDE